MHLNLGLGSVLTIVFAILKLTHVIAWSWWLVFLPIMITGGIGAVIVLVAFIIAACP